MFESRRRRTVLIGCGRCGDADTVCSDGMYPCKGDPPSHVSPALTLLAEEVLTLKYNERHSRFDVIELSAVSQRSALSAPSTSIPSRPPLRIQHLHWPLFLPRSRPEPSCFSPVQSQPTHRAYRRSHHRSTTTGLALWRSVPCGFALPPLYV